MKQRQSNFSNKRMPKIKNINETWVALLSAIGLIGFGFSIGLWVGNVDKKDELRQKDIEWERKLDDEKKEWEKERRNDAIIEGFNALMSNMNNKEKNDNKK